MNILILSDSFKGSLSSAKTGAGIARGFKRVFPEARYRVLSMADGGEGTVEALVSGVGGRWYEKTVTGPLGEPVSARYAVLNNGTAAMEMAEASGIALIAPEERDPNRATTYGTGELIKDALDNGAKKIFIGIGGSATNDGGSGMAAALGVRFLKKDGTGIAPGGRDLINLHRIDVSGLDPRLKNVEVTVACDVKNPLYGPNGASCIFGPQKGADPETVKALDAALRNYGEKLRELLGRDIANIPGAGAAGGLGAGLIAFCGGVLKPGIDEITAALELDKHMQWADIAVTGEGQIDKTSAMGKVLSGVGALGKKYGKPVIAFGGGIGAGAEAVYEAGITAYTSITHKPMELSYAIENAEALIEGAAERTARMIKVGTILGPA